ncbi:hypothetical protein DT075_11350 [Bacillus licheniformis]|nr:hypothetical protein DT075_11350 [Bacillus licheniformis]
MTVVGFCVLLCSAFIHASWNYLSKKADGGVPFIWLFTAIAAVIYTLTGKSPVTGTMIAVRLINKKGTVLIYRDVHLTRGKPHFRVSFPTKKLKPGKYDVWVDAVKGKKWHGRIACDIHTV